MNGLTYIDQKTPIFFLQSLNLEGRLDPYYYNSALKDFTESKHFEVVKIKQVVKSFQSGFGVGKQDQANDETDGIIQIRPTNLNNYGKLKFNKNVFIPKELITSEKHLLLNGDVVFNNTNSQEWVGKTAYYDLDEKLAFSNHITVLKVDKEKIEPEYLWIILNLYQQKKIFFSICTNWNNQSGVGLELLKNLKIPLPKQDKQREIINCLKLGYSQKHQKEAEAQELLNSIDEYLLGELGITLPQKDNSLESRMFTTPHTDVSGRRLDPNYSLPYYGSLTDLIQLSDFQKLGKIIDFSSETWDQRSLFNHTFPYLEISEIDTSTGLINQINHIEITEAPSRAKKIIRSGDLVVSTTRPTRGAIAEVKDEHNLNICSTGFAVLRNLKTPKVNKHFLFHILRSAIVRDQMEQRSSGGNYPAITEDELRQILIPIPNILKQEEMVEVVSSKKAKAIELRQEARKNLNKAQKQIEQMILKN